MENPRIVPLTARQLAYAILLWVDLRGGSSELVCHRFGPFARLIMCDLTNGNFVRDLLVWGVVKRDEERELCPGHPLVYLSEWFDQEGWGWLRNLLGCPVDLRQTYHLGLIADWFITQTRDKLLQTILDLTPKRLRYEGEPDKDWLLGLSLHEARMTVLLDSLACSHRLLQLHAGTAYQELAMAEVRQLQQTFAQEVNAE